MWVDGRTWYADRLATPTDTGAGIVQMETDGDGDRHLVCEPIYTRNSSGDEIANVNFLYDDIVHAVKIQ